MHLREYVLLFFVANFISFLFPITKTASYYEWLLYFTIQEGAEFLKRSGAEELIAKPDEEAKPEVHRDTTIEATVKEAEAFLESEGKVEGRTRTEAAAATAAAEKTEEESTDASQEKSAESTAEADSSAAEETPAAEAAPPKVQRDSTMVETAKVFHWKTLMLARY